MQPSLGACDPVFPASGVPRSDVVPDTFEKAGLLGGNVQGHKGRPLGAPAIGLPRLHELRADVEVSPKHRLDAWSVARNRLAGEPAVYEVSCGSGHARNPLSRLVNRTRCRRRRCFTHSCAFRHGLTGYGR